MSVRSRAWALAGAVCGIVVGLDQATKAIARAELDPDSGISVIGPLELTEAYNSGVAFGLLSGGGALLIAATALALVAILLLFAREPERPGAPLATGLLLGGALGNLIDRARAGEVTDFIDIALWPAFNLADVAITAGVVLLAISYLREPEAA